MSVCSTYRINKGASHPLLHLPIGYRPDFIVFVLNKEKGKGEEESRRIAIDP